MIIARFSLSYSKFEYIVGISLGNNESIFKRDYQCKRIFLIFFLAEEELEMGKSAAHETNKNYYGQW